jgi:prolipoprotein diacylglyceryltransferase
MLEAAMESAVLQMGIAAMHWYAIIAITAVVLLSAAWMAAGLSRTAREL